MKILIISDIHGNAEALKAIISKETPVDHSIFLGDALLSGPQANETMDLIDAANDDSLKDKVRFIHINHTNPLRDQNSEAFRHITERGYKLAYRGERFCL